MSSEEAEVLGAGDGEEEQAAPMADSASMVAIFKRLIFITIPYILFGIGIVLCIISELYYFLVLHMINFYFRLLFRMMILVIFPINTTTHATRTHPE